MTKDEVKKICLVLKAAYSNKFEISDMTVPIFHEILKGIPHDIAHKCTLAYISEGTEWPPGPGQLLAYIRRTMEPRKLTGDEAWAYAVQLAFRFGMGGEEMIVRTTNGIRKMSSGQFKANQECLDFPEVHKTIKVIGYEKICKCRHQDLPYMGNEFRRIYEAMLADGKKPEISGQKNLEGNQAVARLE